MWTGRRGVKREEYGNGSSKNGRGAAASSVS